VVKTDPFGERLDGLKRLLERNGISWISTVKTAHLTGLDYQTGKAASFSFGPGDIIINIAQPKSCLLRVLFERNSRLSDSVTYDITAWSLPFVFGLQTYGLPALPDPSSRDFATQSAEPISLRPESKTTFAYTSPWTGMRSARFLSQLLKKGIKVRFAEQPFQTGRPGMEFDRGSLIIVKANNATIGVDLDTLLIGMSGRTGVTLWPVSSGFVDKGEDFGSSHVHMIHKPRVALLTGQQVNSLNAGEVWHLFEQELDYPVSLIDASGLSDISWKDYDVVILPDGEYKFTEDRELSDRLKSWVKQGGRLIAMENAVAQLAKGGWGILQKADSVDIDDENMGKKETDYSSLRKYGDRQRQEATRSVPGSIYRVEMDNSHPLAFGYPGYYYTLKQDDRVFEYFKDGGWNVGVIKKDNYISGFTGSKAKEKLKDGLIFGVQEMGKGKIVYMADDPLFRSFWENGKLLFCNAVFLVGQ
jgi:hypothetical protein